MNCNEKKEHIWLDFVEGDHRHLSSPESYGSAGSTGVCQGAVYGRDAAR